MLAEKETENNETNISNLKQFFTWTALDENNDWSGKMTLQ